MKKRTRGKYQRLDAEKFVRLWQAAETLDEAVKKYGLLTRIQMSMQACNLRKKGVNLKRFHSAGARPIHDYAALAKLAKKAEK